MGKSKGRSSLGGLPVPYVCPISQADIDDVTALLAEVPLSDQLEALSRVHAYVRGLGAGNPMEEFGNVEAGVKEITILAFDTLGRKKALESLREHFGRVVTLFRSRERSQVREREKSASSVAAESTAAWLSEVRPPSRQASKKCAGCARPRTYCECQAIAEEKAEEMRTAKRSTKKKDPPPTPSPKFFIPPPPAPPPQLKSKKEPTPTPSEKDPEEEDEEDEDEEETEVTEEDMGNDPADDDGIAIKLSDVQDPKQWRKHSQEKLHAALTDRYLDPIPRDKEATRGTTKKLIAVAAMSRAKVVRLDHMMTQVVDLLERNLQYAKGRTNEQLKEWEETVAATEQHSRYATANKKAQKDAKKEKTTTTKTEATTRSFSTSSNRLGTCPGSLWRLMPKPAQDEWKKIREGQQPKRK